MKWVTRERPKIDRIACPWLIARFIDDRAEFLYVPSKDVLPVAERTGAIPYDIPGVELSHAGELCSFDAFLKKYHLADPVLHQLAVIVRGADTSRLDLTPQSAGLYAISLGLSHKFSDDHEMLAHGMVMYDALYEWVPVHPSGNPQLAAGDGVETRRDPAPPKRADRSRNSSRQFRVTATVLRGGFAPRPSLY